MVNSRAWKMMAGKSVTHDCPDRPALIFQSCSTIAHSLQSALFNNHSAGGIAKMERKTGCTSSASDDPSHVSSEQFRISAMPKRPVAVVLRADCEAREPGRGF